MERALKPWFGYGLIAFALVGGACLADFQVRLKRLQ